MRSAFEYHLPVKELAVTVDTLRAREILLDAELLSTDAAMARRIQGKLMELTKETMPWLLPKLIVTD